MANILSLNNSTYIWLSDLVGWELGFGLDSILVPLVGVGSMGPIGPMKGFPRLYTKMLKYYKKFNMSVKENII